CISEELQYLAELNTISTTLPLYLVSINGKTAKTLIDSGASENYVSPNAIAHIPQKQLIPVYDRQVETAGGDITRIEYKVTMDINLNGYHDVANTTHDTVTAFVSPTKFDLILGRSWLQQTQPVPDW
ncbi:hypothetical protein K501DRAFT_142442, partial [Backusella circina FSU 941]